MGPTLAALATAKVLAGIVGFILGEPPGAAARAVPLVVHLALILTFAVAGGVLLAGGQRDRRARQLGVAMLLAATPFADMSISFIPGSFPSLAGAVHVVRHLRLEAFLPYFWWLFVSDFPRVVTFGWPARALRLVRATSLAVGVALFGINLVLLAREGLPLPDGLWVGLGLFDRSSGTSAYWAVLLILVAPTLPFALWKAKRARIDERRRVTMVMAGLVVGSSPILIGVLLSSLPIGLAAWIRSPTGIRLTGLVIYPALLTIPLAVAHAVIVHRALDVRLVVRKALRYSLTRYTLLAVAVVPFAAMAVLLFRNRDQTLAQLLTAPEGLVLQGAAVFGLATLAVRTRVREALDRRFFREQYDARRILGDLVEGSGRVDSAPDLARLLTNEVDRALHLASAHVLLADGGGLLRSPGGDVRPLERSSPIVGLARVRQAPVEVDLENPEPDVQSLPAEAHRWLADAACRLLVPLTDTSGGVLAIMALGEKRSELPFSSEDRSLLTDLAGAASRSLAHLTTAFSEETTPGLEGGPIGQVAPPADPGGSWVAQPGMDDDPRALECISCGLIQEPSPKSPTACGRCAHALTRSTIPPLIFGKYRLAERIGRGGMGVVYRGLDLSLGRDVAIKTLPRMSPTQSLQLRREARAVAAVSHPNLATIYGAESWLGIPILIFEYLAGGDLSNRINESPLDVGAALQLGMTMADVASAIHDAGILHRDIKPSNIGFTLSGVPKLLDFGVATLPRASRSEADERAIDTFAGEGVSARDRDADVDQAVGTLPYLSPEAVDGQTAEPGFDLWSITLVVYEALAGTNPMWAGNHPMTVLRISDAEVPDIREFRPDCPAPVAEFFKTALAPDRRRRPANGRELRSRLGALKGILALHAA